MIEEYIEKNGALELCNTILKDTYNNATVYLE